MGKYEVNSEYSILISCNNNQLVAQINGEPKFEIFAQNLESFFSKEEDLRMKFKSDNSTTFNKISIFRGLNTKRGVKVE